MTEAYKETIERILPIAKQFISNYNIQYPIKDSVELLSNMGYYIVKAQAPNNLSGFYMKKDKYPFIFVNTRHSKGRQNFSLWHEVYHHYMGHQNGISEFNPESLVEREAEIFAGIVLLPNSEIEKWMDKEKDIMRPEVLARMSVYYQMSFNAVMIRAMQLNPIPYEKYQQLKALSRKDHSKQLYAIYTENNLETDILEPTNDIQISQNIMTILEKNYNNGLTTGAKINEMIQRIEVLNNET